MKYIVLVLLGLVVGYLLADYLQGQNTIVETVTEYKTDTVFVEIRDTVTITRTEIKHEYLRDTFLVEPIKPEIKAFKATYSFLYGNATVNGEVLGEVLKTSLITDFSLPTITNTITTTKTITKKPKGIYLGGGLSSKLDFSIGVDLLKNNNLYGYDYQRIGKENIHWISYKRNFF